MSTGPNQILIKRSDVAGVVPSGLSFGEPAINSSDGILFFSQQTQGSATNDLWEFRGFTNEGFVRSVNGATGSVNVPDRIVEQGDIDDAGIDDATILVYSPDGGADTNFHFLRVTDHRVIGNYVKTFNGETGDVGVTSSTLHVGGLSCDGGITIGSIGLGICGEGDLRLGANSDIILDENSSIFPSNQSDEGPIEIKFNNQNIQSLIEIGELGEEKNATTFRLDDKTSIISLGAAGHGVTAEVTGTLHVKHLGASTNAGGISTEGGSTFGSTLQVDGNIHTNAGISADGGISGDHIHSTTGNIGGVVLSSGVMVGTATSALTASSATSATSATNVAIEAVSDDTDYRVIFAQHAGGGTSTLNSKVDTGSGADGLIYNPSTDLLSLGGISAGAGCTFSDIVNIGGNLNVNGGATFEGNVLIDGGTDEDAKLTIRADTDNNDENDNPLIRLEQDGGAISASIGMLGDDDAQFSGALANMFYIEADGSAGNHTHGIQFATSNSAVMTINGDGNVGINEKFPAQKLDVDGVIVAQQGVSADGGVTLGGTLRVDGNVNVGTTLDVDGNIDISGDIISSDDLNIQRPSGELVVSFLGSSTIINNSATNQDVIIKGLGEGNLFYSDAENNKIGIGTSTPLEKIDVVGTIAASTGLTLGGGITFSDGTHQSTALRTDSYTGQIETASDKTYTIDPFVSTARTITGYFIQSGSGTVTATLKNGSNTVKAASVSTTSGDQSSLSNTSVAAGATLSIVTSSNSSATDVIFNVEYTSSS